MPSISISVAKIKTSPLTFVNIHEHTQARVGRRRVRRTKKWPIDSILPLLSLTLECTRTISGWTDDLPTSLSTDQPTGGYKREARGSKSKVARETASTNRILARCLPADRPIHELKNERKKTERNTRGVCTCRSAAEIQHAAHGHRPFESLPLESTCK